MVEARASVYTLVLSVMALSFTKLSKLFLYSLVPVNQRWKRSEPLAKQKEVANKKGVVGRTGKITPNKPRPKQMKPTVR